MYVLYALVGVWLVSIAVLVAYLFWPSVGSCIVVDDDPWLKDLEPMIRVSDHVTISSTLVPAPNAANFQNGLIFAAVAKRPWAVAQNQGI